MSARALFIYTRPADEARMDISSIIFNQQGRARSGWRFLVYLIAVMMFSQLLYLLTTLLILALAGQSTGNRFLESTWGWVVQSGMAIAAASLVGGFCGRMMEGLPFKALGWALHRRWFLDWLKGTILGALSLSLAALIIYLCGGYKFSFAPSAMMGAVSKTLSTSAVVFIIAAAAEEVMFRGYGLQTMTRARLSTVGLVITSILFSLVHMGNPNVVPGWTFLNTTLAGVWLAAAYLRTRSLWFPLGLHWSWNWTMGALLGLPVSGIGALTPQPLMRAADAGPAWLTGGSYGVEGGAACTVVILLSTVFVWRTRWLSAAPEMLTLTDKENPKTAPAPSHDILVETSPALEERTPLKTNS
jgi:uncharacterized protein